MVFKVPESKASLPENRFEFEIGGKTYDVAKLQFISGEVVNLIAEAEASGSEVQELASQYAIFGPPGTPVGDAVRTLERAQLEDLLRAYQEASRITVGESSGSVDS